MERADRELILRHVEYHAVLRRLFQEHQLLEKKLSCFEHRGFLTAREEIERNLLKKRKLLGVDRMLTIARSLDVNSDGGSNLSSDISETPDLPRPEVA